MSIKAMETVKRETLTNYGKKKGGRNMKRKYLKQLFEGEAGSGSDAGQAGSAGGSQAGAADQGGDAGKDGKKSDGGGSDEKKYSDADVDKIVQERLARQQAQSQKAQQKAVDEATKLATMTAQEKAEYERDQLQKELDSLKKAQVMSEMGKTARQMLSADGLNVPDSLVDMIVAPDAETTKTNVKQFSKMFKAAVQDGVKEALKGKAPGTGSASTVTKEDIMKIKDRVERQRMIAEHMDLFK